VQQTGIVIIGRNEGPRLRRAISSIQHQKANLIYVDSGSSDGSLELSHELGVDVHSLDPAHPFSPARARAEGAAILIKTKPNLRFIQFLDGDCELVSGWIENAIAHFEENDNVAIVCGKLSETAPELSIYNRMSPIKWKLPSGEILTCGGIFMIRREVYEMVGGFDTTLITHEESDLCERVRAIGYKVSRIDASMAKHDSGLIHFSQWWARAVWGGYGDALGISQLPGKADNQKRLRWYITGPIGTSALFIGGLIGMLWRHEFLICLLAAMAIQGILFARIFRGRLLQGDSAYDSMIFSGLSVLRNFACGFGFILYYLNRGNHFKRPDPHGPLPTAKRK
jgi:GT2 family glycosyltransferase